MHPCTILSGISCYMTIYWPQNIRHCDCTMKNWFIKKEWHSLQKKLPGKPKKYSLEFSYYLRIWAYRRNSRIDMAFDNTTMGSESFWSWILVIVLIFFCSVKKLSIVSSTFKIFVFLTTLWIFWVLVDLPFVLQNFVKGSYLSEKEYSKDSLFQEIL